MIDIFFEIGMPDVLDRADAGLTLEGLLSGEDGHAGSKLGIILKIEGDLPGIVAIEAGHAVFDVCGVTNLRCFFPSLKRRGGAKRRGGQFESNVSPSRPP